MAQEPETERMAGDRGGGEAVASDRHYARRKKARRRENGMERKRRK